MEFVTTESFVSPLKGFLILPPATQEKKSETIYCKLDDKPRHLLAYIIGSIRNVNQKITHLEWGLKKMDSSDLVIEDGLKRHQTQRTSRKVLRESRVKEKDQKVLQKTGGHGSEIEILIAQGKIAQKKMVTEKDKLVELYQYPGYCKEELTLLPNGVELDEILEKVIRAQSKTIIGKTKWSVKMLRRFLGAPCIQAILLDSFWWQFLHLYHPNREIQGHLFERIAENYSRALLGCHKVSNQEHLLTFFPSLLSQAVYTCFCYCFPRSWFNTCEFKAQLCDVFSEWLGGTLHAPGSYSKWDYSQLEPERSRREDMLAGKGKMRTDSDVSFGCKEVSTVEKLPKQKRLSLQNVVRKHMEAAKNPITRKTDQQQLSKRGQMHHFDSRSVPCDDELKEKKSWNKSRSSQKKKLKFALLSRESHPACCGPEFTWHLLNIGGNSPLIQHFLQKRHATSKAGCDIFLPRREICKPIPDSAQTYAEVIKEGFHILEERHKAFTKTYWRHWREMKNFDQQCKDNQEIFRQEMQEEMKRSQAQKQKELLAPPLDGLNTSRKISFSLPEMT